MIEFDYKSFYDKVGKTNGWDFSKLQVRSEVVSWDFNEEVKKKSSNVDILLDIGTGGGENVLTIAASFLFLVGIDSSYGMIETAQTNFKKAGILNARFSQMSSDKLKFPAGFFDVVTCRHAPFSSMEVNKVLKKGGYFLTQQVGEGDKINIKRAFNRGKLVEENGTLLARYVRELKESGFSEIQYFENDAIEYYQRPEDLIFLLKHTPTIPNFGEKSTDFEILNDFIENHRTEKGIRTNSKRFLIIAKK
ncbi:class I SAM-dependent methyltransferase [Paraliobacillus sp. X-1268]|uniref:class I SAM-dependent methyltransferase n=1 Tax=Paraliobacillus sp. X-1268 TaxID=2213193 RepID=UPI000E3C3FFF|nr:class I SAM-dependent methyltransferase [Paraliobacillus sp. X-1268]